eukprot:526160-Hanusia_phi.AAC.3
MLRVLVCLLLICGGEGLREAAKGSVSSFTSMSTAILPPNSDDGAAFASPWQQFVAETWGIYPKRIKEAIQRGGQPLPYAPPPPSQQPESAGNSPMQDVAPPSSQVQNGILPPHIVPEHGQDDPDQRKQGEGKHELDSNSPPGQDKAEEHQDAKDDKTAPREEASSRSDLNKDRVKQDDQWEGISKHHPPPSSMTTCPSRINLAVGWSRERER